MFFSYQGYLMFNTVKQLIVMVYKAKIEFNTFLYAYIREPISHAFAVAFLAEGKTIGEAWEIAPEAVAEYLETLPEDHFHCAELAVGALYLALSDDHALSASSFEKCGMGAVLGLGRIIRADDIARLSWQLLQDQDRRRDMRAAGLTTIDGRAADRAINQQLSLGPA